MKKSLLLIVAVILGNCEVKPRATHANSSYNWNERYHYKEEIRDGMTYGIWYVAAGGDRTGYSMAVVNLTKDKLEIELLRKQLGK